MSAESSPTRGRAPDVLSILTASTGPEPSRGAFTGTAARVLVGAEVDVCSGAAEVVTAPVVVELVGRAGGGG